VYCPGDEEVYGCSVFADDDHLFGFEDFPEERTTTKPDPLGISDTGSRATASVRRSVDPIANNHPTQGPAPPADQAQGCEGLPESRVPPHSLSQIPKSPLLASGNAS
jgi:hypothetical protein